jgi:broad specificity phosphatase PhoE
MGSEHGQNNSEKKTLWLVRHGEVDDAYCNTYVGRSNPQLSPKGKNHIRCLARRLASGDLHISRCISSPMISAQQTPQIHTELLSIPVQTDSELREIDFGKWDGLPYSQIAEEYPALVEQWASEGMNFVFPDGDRVTDFWNRVCGAGLRIVSESAKNTLIVAHGGVIRFLICHFLGISPGRHHAFKIQHASLTTIEICEGHAVLLGLNDICHMEGE